MLSHFGLGRHVWCFDEALWLRFLFCMQLGIVMLYRAAGTTGRCVTIAIADVPIATPTDIVYGVRAYRRAGCRRHRDQLPCLPKGDGALSFSLALYVPPL